MPAGVWTSPMVGREAEFTTMRRGLSAASQGACTCRVVSGGHGVGKTRLLQETVDHATAQGFITVRAVAYPSDANVPYSIVADALSPLVRQMDPNGVRTLLRGADAELAHIIPALGESGERAPRPDVSGDPTPRLRWHTAQFLARLSAKAPLLFTVDNAQWADPSSVSLLHFVLRHAPEARLMVATAFNHLETEAVSPIRTMAKAIAGLPGSEQLTLAPLTESDIRELLTQSFLVDESQIRSFATFLHSRTLGNPFFVEEMIKTLIQRGTLHRIDDRWVGWDVEDIDVPSTIREVLLERVNALTPHARSVADLASVAGSRVSHELLRRTSGLSDVDLLAATDGLRKAHVMNEVEEGADIIYDFTHPLLQRTLYEEVGAARRRELHTLMARTLEEGFGDDAERHATELAFHFVRANAPALAPKSVTYLRRAGVDAMAMHADREAARYLQHGLDLMDRGEPASEDTSATPELVEQLARVRQRLGEYDASRTLWLRARDLCAASDDHAGLARVERRIGMLAFWSGHAHLSIGHYDEALAHARVAGTPDIEARTMVTKGMALMALGKPEEAKRIVHAALDLVQDLGDVGLRARVEHALVVMYAYAGPADVANGFAQRLLADAEAAGEQGLAWAAHHATAVLACFTANAASVAHHVAEADRIAKALLSPMLAAQIAAVAVEYASAKGEWAEGLALAERMIPIARAMSPRSLLPRMLVWTGSILLNRDESERAKACFDEAWELSRAGTADASGADLNAVIVAHIGQAAYAHHAREWLMAIEFAQRGIAIADRHGMTSWTLHQLLPLLSESASWSGDFALAEKAAARLRADSARFDHKLGEAWAFTVDQLVGRWRDKTPGVVERLIASAESIEAVPYVFHAARLRRHVARLLALDGDRDGAARELRLAHDVFLRIGAALELRLTREAMRQLGVRPPQTTVVQGGALTSREREVAELVARRKTNKEIARALDISARTVSTHLSNVFLKLGVDSRGALADLVRSDLRE